MSVVFGREGREARFGIIRLQVVTPLLRSTTVDTGQNNKSFISKLHKTGLGCLCVVRHLHFQQFEHTWSVRKCAISERWDQQPIFTLFSLDIRPHFCLQTAVSQWQPYNHRIGCIRHLLHSCSQSVTRGGHKLMVRCSFPLSSLISFYLGNPKKICPDDVRKECPRRIGMGWESRHWPKRIPSLPFRTQGCLG